MSLSRKMTGIERHWLDEDIAKVRTYLNADPDLVSDGCIEEIMAHTHQDT